MAMRSRMRPVAIALVVEEDNGDLTLYGSKQLDRFTISVEHDIETSTFGQYVQYRAASLPPFVRIEAECRGLVIYHATSAPTPPQIEQRGIYLPDMSFRALPGTEER
jgi:hypothetical protein